VTCYFPIGNRAKHSQLVYRRWILRFVTSIKSPLVVYCPRHVAHSLRKMRKRLAISFEVYDDVWSLPPSKNLRAFYTNQLRIDGERAIHSTELYATWNARPWMLLDAAKRNVFNTTYFAQVDIGSVREGSRIFQQWPDILALEQFMPENSMLLSDISTTGPIKPYHYAWGPLKGNQWHDFGGVQGGFYAGTLRSISWFTPLFYCLLTAFAKEGHFVGKDQDILNSLVSMSSNIRLLPSGRLQGRCGGSPWFAFWEILSDPSERSQTCPISFVQTYLPVFPKSSMIHECRKYRATDLQV